jgi:gluconate 5-dehydrogenase
MEGQVALVTGGGTGLGYGIAKCLAEAGAKVVIAGRRADVLEAAVRSLGENCTARVFDVTAKSRAGELVADIEKNVGPLTTLVNCAGAHLKKIATETTDEEFLKILDVHVLSVFALSREVLKAMLPEEKESDESWPDENRPEENRPEESEPDEKRPEEKERKEQDTEA